jgi:hypothetical protein
MPGLGQGLPWRDMIGTSSYRFNSAKREALNSVPACQVWARGHNQKKDTHTLDFDVTWLSGPAFFAKRQFWVAPGDFVQK